VVVVVGEEEGRGLECGGGSAGGITVDVMGDASRCTVADNEDGDSGSRFAGGKVRDGSWMVASFVTSCCSSYSCSCDSTRSSRGLGDVRGLLGCSRSLEDLFARLETRKGNSSVEDCGVGSDLGVVAGVEVVELDEGWGINDRRLSLFLMRLPILQGQGNY
jgi:hypothetical protein